MSQSLDAVKDAARDAARGDDAPFGQDYYYDEIIDSEVVELTAELNLLHRALETVEAGGYPLSTDPGWFVSLLRNDIVTTEFNLILAWAAQDFTL